MRITAAVLYDVNLLVSIGHENRIVTKSASTARAAHNRSFDSTFEGLERDGLLRRALEHSGIVPGTE